MILRQPGSTLFPTRRSSDLLRVCRDGTQSRSKRDRNIRLPRKRDRKSTRLNSSHVAISYAVFCLKKKNNILVNIKTLFLSNRTFNANMNMHEAIATSSLVDH